MVGTRPVYPNHATGQEPTRMRSAHARGAALGHGLRRRRSLHGRAIELIIDAHCHAGRGDLLTEPWRTNAPLGAYLRRARAAGIDRTIVLPASRTDYAAANRELARLVAAHRPRLIGFAGLHAARDAGRIHNMVAQAVRDFGFRGLKVHGDEAQPTREVC